MTKIQLFDRGTPEGKKLWERLERVCQRLQIEYSPELTNKMEKVYQLGIQGKTVLMVNNEVVAVDQYPEESELFTIISDYL